MKIRTKTQEFNIAILGVASFDGALRFEILNPDLPKIFATFTDPSELDVIVHVWDDSTEQRYEHFSVFKSINVQATGSVIVALSPGL